MTQPADPTTNTGILAKYSTTPEVCPVCGQNTAHRVRLMLTGVALYLADQIVCELQGSHPTT